ncbi:hypothetical protein [Candidatus Nitrospira inopinata]|jgi:hypothetical protein|uniref:hypothetical protein n=1 Tax=Candidatus Nitrospira inopinata TaxID=1715989 RepID=UPI000A62A288|nr:hypothetical protein [Candidatus Nitrospira inopinata]
MTQGLVEGALAISAVASLLTIFVISLGIMKVGTPERVAIPAESRRSRRRSVRE